MTDIIVSVSGIKKRFGKMQALDGVEISIPSGVSGIIGPNGAGKTTLLRVLLGLIRADEGRASVLGLDSEMQSLEIRRRIGVLHERPIYPRFLTPLEYLKMISDLYWEHREPIELLKLVDLDKACDRKIKDLSAGMHQRLGIAQSLVGYPEIVFLDEPTSNLDVTGRNAVLQLIMDLYNNTGTSFVISSHILSELERICHNLVFIDGGKVIESGRLVEIFKKYASDRWRVLTSDSEVLYRLITSLSGFENIGITGVNTISFSNKGDINTIRHEIESIAKEHEIDVYDVSRSTSLEEVFKEVSRNESE
ncbi:MAG: ABC transporter ATP-binding protein [Candidatus Thorarchaeota archaeon]|nr:ABC transporter ATP-binding protein [Candidatus Thorarchaeota archaeon]